MDTGEGGPGPAADQAAGTRFRLEVPEDQVRAPQRLVYDGRPGEIARIFFTTVALSLITFGFYRFWGKTRLRRYLWSHFRLQGESFEYIGTGGELLRGFLKTVVFVGLLVGANYALPMFIDMRSIEGKAGALALVACFGLLFLAAHFAAQRYRLSRTVWCGIRGGMAGSAWAYAAKAGVMFIFSALVIGLYLPWWRMRTIEMRINASRFGNLEAHLGDGRGSCFWSFMLGSFILGIVNAAVGPVLQAIIRARDLSQTQIETIGVALPVVGFFVLIPLAYAPYYASVQHEIFGHLQIGNLRFQSRISTGGIVGQIALSLLLLIGSLGLAFPYVLHRWLVFTTGNVVILGNIDAARLRQSSLATPSTGEGLLEALDPGVL